MKCFIARIKSFLQVEYSWKEFNTQEEENIMKNLKVGNTVFLSPVLAGPSEVEDGSVQCIHSGPDFAYEKGFLPVSFCVS